VNTGALIEQSLARILRSVSGDGGPPRLAAAMQHAVFPGGARFRPRLCLAVAQACDAAESPATQAAACAIELLHCASLAHDDLPCFDDAGTRRGLPSVHRAYGEPLAVLAGDALIVLAFQAVTLEQHIPAEQRLQLLALLGAASGMPHGIAAGQAWECEADVALAAYQRAKTGALFAAATAAGALVGGEDSVRWRIVGEYIGEAYQVADDIGDVAALPMNLGKPSGRDAALGRPNAVGRLGMSAAQRRLRELIDASVESVPDCPGAAELRQRILAATHQLLASRLARPAA
jgi:geranylgeranyl diphosphate synthase, type II